MSDPAVTADPAEHQSLIAAARGKFIAMGGAYSLGAFNDNFLKQAGLVMAVQAGNESYQSYIAGAFTLPFIIFAAYAGWFSDKYSKRSIIVGAKALELVAMCAGGLGIYLASWPLIFIMLFIMGTQATIFSPALNGAIPELYPADYVTQANAKLKVVVTMAILAGIACAGILLNYKDPISADNPIPQGRMYVGISVVVIAIAGFCVSLLVPKFKAADTQEPFPWLGMIETFNVLWETRKDRLLFVAILGDGIFWMLAVLQSLIINPMGLKQLQLNEAKTSYLLLTQMMGVAVGGLLAGALSKGDRWYRVLIPGMLGMAVGMGAVAFVPGLPPDLQVPAVYVLLGVIGMAGGLFMVPLESFIQIRPAPDQKGKIIAAANFSAFTGMMGSSVINLGINGIDLPTSRFAVAGGLAVLTVVWLFFALPKKDAAQS